MAQEGIVLTESQLAAMERAGEEKEANGKTETEHPGYLGAQGTCYVGNIKGTGHIYQQTFIEHAQQGGVLQTVRQEEYARGDRRAELGGDPVL